MPAWRFMFSVLWRNRSQTTYEALWAHPVPSGALTNGEIAISERKRKD
jgi:hypothetical protein